MIKSHQETIEQQALSVVSDYVNALQKGNQTRLAELLDENVIWHQPGKNKFSGVIKGSANVFKAVGGFFEVSKGTFQLSEIKWLTPNGNKVACLLHFKATRLGAVLDMDSIDVYTVENGKIIEAALYSEDQQKEDDFWGY
jgi:uncharacterized protein